LFLPYWLWLLPITMVIVGLSPRPMVVVGVEELCCVLFLQQCVLGVPKMLFWIIILWYILCIIVRIQKLAHARRSMFASILRMTDRRAHDARIAHKNSVAAVFLLRTESISPLLLSLSSRWLQNHL
jgi:hypothetical protein